MANSKYFTTVFLGNISKVVKVGKKTVITMVVPDYYLTKKNNKAEFDSYQINIFDAEYQECIKQDSPHFREIDRALNQGIKEINIQNVEVDVKITMSKSYRNKSGQTVFPHPEFKFLDIRHHINSREANDASDDMVEDVKKLSEIRTNAPF